MKKIAIVHKGKAYIPEATVYQELLSAHGFQVVYCQTDTKLIDGDYDIEWHIMGTDFPSFSSQNKYVIHEYLSVSVPPFARFKNLLKKIVNRRPDLRVFNGYFIESEFNFQDGVQHIVRNPGVSAHFFFDSKPQKEYDFAYLGAMDRSRNVLTCFDWICEKLPLCSIIAIGEPPPVRNLKQRYPNIHFAGRVPHQDVPPLLKSAEYGLNLIPHRYPYHLQPSYKLIEYCAAGLKVITTDYPWANYFEQIHQGRFFKLNHQFANLNMASLSHFPFLTPDTSQLTWANSFRQSGLLDLLLKI